MVHAARRPRMARTGRSDSGGGRSGRRARGPRDAPDERDDGDGRECGDEQHGDLPRPVLRRAERHAVVRAVHGDAGIQRAGLLVEHAEREAEEAERQEERRVGRGAVDRAEDGARDERRGPEPAPVLQRGEEEPAEEELLGDRRDDRHEERDAEERRGAAVDAELLRELVLVRAHAEDRDERRGEDVEAHPREHRPADRGQQARRARAEVGRRHAPGHAGEQDCAADEADVLDDRREDLHRGRLVLEVGAEGDRDHPEHERAEQRGGEPGDERDERHPRRPPRGGAHVAGLRRLGVLEIGRLGRGLGRHRLPPEGTRLRYPEIRPSSDATVRTPGGAASPSRATKTGVMPAASAPSTSAATSSPAWTASAGATAPASSSARAKIAGSGFAAPNSADVITASTSGRSSVRSRTSCSDTSQFDTTTRATPRSRSAPSTAGTSGYARKRIAASMASSTSASGSAVPSSACTIAAQRRRRSFSPAKSLASSWLRL